MKKRLLAAIMSLCMIVSLMPVSVLAEEPQLRRLNYWHYLYEYNPMTKEYVRVSGDQSSALHAAREAYGITPEHSSTNYAPIPEGVTVPQGNDNQVTINETYDLPQMTYTYEGVDYTWLCTGYEIDNVVHEWTEDELNARIAKRDFSDKKNQILTIYYHWVQIDKLEENAPDNYERVTFTFDYGKHIIDDDSQGPGPNVELTIPEGCDFSNATVTLYGADSKFDFPSEIRDAIDSESIKKIGAEDGTFTASWPKGYYFTLDDLLKNQPNGYSHYYIKISCTPYEWYGHIEGWRDSAGKNFSGGVAGDESATFYARYHTHDAYFSSYVAAEGYTLVRIRNGNILKAGSDWSYDEFQAVRNQITVPDWNFPTYQIAVQNEDWKITVPSPGATSVAEEGAVLLSDGTYTWQCIGVQYEVYGETAQTVALEIPHVELQTRKEHDVEQSRRTGKDDAAVPQHEVEAVRSDNGAGNDQPQQRRNAYLVENKRRAKDDQQDEQKLQYRIGQRQGEVHGGEKGYGGHRCCQDSKRFVKYNLFFRNFQLCGGVLFGVRRQTPVARGSSFMEPFTSSGIAVFVWG